MDDRPQALAKTMKPSYQHLNSPKSVHPGLCVPGQDLDTYYTKLPFKSAAWRGIVLLYWAWGFIRDIPIRTCSYIFFGRSQCKLWTPPKSRSRKRSSDVLIKQTTDERIATFHDKLVHMYIYIYTYPHTCLCMDIYIPEMNMWTYVLMYICTYTYIPKHVLTHWRELHGVGSTTRNDMNYIYIIYI